MSNESNDWTAWAIGALGIMATALVGMGRIIMGISTTRITQLEKQLADYVIFSDNRAQEMNAAHAECIKNHHDAELRLAALEGKPRRASPTKIDEMKGHQ